MNEVGGDQQEAEFVMSPSVAQSSLVGQVLGEKYRIERPIGQGGFGIVYCATHIGLSKPRAVKVLRQISEDRQRRLELETRALAELDHPYIVAVVDVGVADDSPYLVMEYVEGKSLGDILAIEEKLSLQRTLAIMKCVCSAVHYAHEHGIIHRDLKPSNIIVQRFSGEGEIAKVLDFGLAKFLQQYDPDRVAGPTTESGMILGTVEYLSPEQCSGQPIDARSDIYALGVVLYQMLTGVVPFRGETPFAILTQHINAPPPRIRDVCPELPASVELVICRAMAKDPAKRQQTALELRDELEKAILHPDQAPVEETEEISPTVRLPSQEALRRWPRRLWNTKVIMAIAGVLIAAFSALHFYPGRETAPQPWVLPDLGGWREAFTLTQDGRPSATQWDAPPTWKIVPGEEAKGDGALLVQGPGLGTLRLPEGTALYDFWLQFPVTIVQGRKITWALRLQNRTDYYFFELAFPESEQESVQFQGYVYNQAFDQRHPFKPVKETTTVFGPVQAGDVYYVEVLAIGHRFIYKFTGANERTNSYPGPYQIELQPEPQDCKYLYGTIGFGNLSDGEALKIENVQIRNVITPQNQQPVQ
ncbi:MAG: serine/threonine protein kinase [Acidobacteria bacterium]|nr:serine/threonine protein kinase [Acidobacteriota bacterium]